MILRWHFISPNYTALTYSRNLTFLSPSVPYKENDNTTWLYEKHLYKLLKISKDINKIYIFNKTVDLLTTHYYFTS